MRCRGLCDLPDSSRPCTGGSAARVLRWGVRRPGLEGGVGRWCKTPLASRSGHRVVAARTLNGTAFGNATANSVRLSHSVSPSVFPKHLRRVGSRSPESDWEIQYPTERGLAVFRVSEKRGGVASLRGLPAVRLGKRALRSLRCSHFQHAAAPGSSRKCEHAAFCGLTWQRFYAPSGSC